MVTSHNLGLRWSRRQDLGSRHLNGDTVGERPTSSKEGMRKADVTSARASDKHQETRVEDQVDHLLQKLQPTRVADQRRR